MADYKFSSYSIFPYFKDGLIREREDELWQELFYAFKNGRSYMEGPLSFDQVLEIAAHYLDECPATTEAEIAVPIPRSGNSKKSFGKDPDEWPNLALCERLAEKGIVSDSRVLIERHTPTKRASSNGDRKVRVHLHSCDFGVPQEFKEASLLLVDDLVSTGTQSMACYVGLKNAGHEGPIESVYFSQNVDEDYNSLQTKPFLRHLVVWNKKYDRATRYDKAQWLTEGPVSLPDPG